MDNINLTNHFLIAMPQLDDPNFYHSVTYICQHDEQGAMGVVINRPLDVELGEVFDQLDIKSEDPAVNGRAIYFGGPVQQERGFVLHSPERIWTATMVISDEVAITTSSDILSDIAHHNGPHKHLIAIGYAGWEAGQLEQEIADNAWLSCPATGNIIFDLANDQRWQAAASLLGIDLQFLSDHVGHA